MDAQPSRRAAAGEENPAAAFECAQQILLDVPCPARLGKLAILRHHVAVHLEKQVERLRDITLRHIAELRGDRMRSFSSQRAQLELAAHFQEFFRALP